MLRRGIPQFTLIIYYERCKNARIICTDADSERNIIGLIRIKIGEVAYEYYPNGIRSYGYESDLDLFFVDEKKKGWINIYLDAENSSYVGTCIYKSKEEAEESGKKWSCYITTVKIEWEK